MGFLSCLINFTCSPIVPKCPRVAHCSADVFFDALTPKPLAPVYFKEGFSGATFLVHWWFQCICSSRTSFSSGVEIPSAHSASIVLLLLSIPCSESLKSYFRMGHSVFKLIAVAPSLNAQQLLFHYLSHVLFRIQHSEKSPVCIGWHVPFSCRHYPRLWRAWSISEISWGLQMRFL